MVTRTPSLAIALTLAMSFAAPAAFAQATAPAAPAAAPAAAAPAAPASKTAKPRTAQSLECSKKADAANIHGKPRKSFMSKCKAGKA